MHALWRQRGGADVVSFHMWRKGLEKKPEPRQITWVCGERVLVDEVVTNVLEYLKPAPWNYASLSAADSSERAIWAEAEQHSMDNAPRVVVVRHAQELKDHDRFLDWIKDRTRNARTYLVLVSDDERIPKTEVTPEQKRKGMRPEVLPHLKAVGPRGHVIECRPFTSQTAHHSIPWVQSKVRMPDQVARHLMERSNFELRRVRDICVKLAVFDGSPTIPLINELLRERPRDDFMDALFTIDRKGALLALKEVPESEYGLMLGRIDAQLDLVGMIHDMQAEYHSPYEITKAAGTQAFLVPSLIPVAKHYDSKRRHSIRRMLAVCDAAHRGGISTGVMEGLIATW
jgi:hypothetical protein